MRIDMWLGAWFCVFSFLATHSLSQDGVQTIIIGRDPKDFEKIVRDVVAKADSVPDLTLVATANYAEEIGRHADAAYLATVGQLRIQYDLARFPPNDNAAQYARRARLMGTEADIALCKSPKSVDELLGRIESWRPTRAGEYRPRYEFRETSEKAGLAACDAARKRLLETLKERKGLLRNEEYVKALAIFLKFDAPSGTTTDYFPPLFALGENPRRGTEFRDAVATLRRIEVESKTNGWLASGSIASAAWENMDKADTASRIQEQLMMGPDRIGLLERVLKQPDEHTFMTLTYAAIVALDEERVEDAMFLYLIAPERLFFDFEAFPPRAQGGDSPIHDYMAIHTPVAVTIDPISHQRPKSYLAAVERAEAWVPQAKPTYRPDYDFESRKPFNEAIAEWKATTRTELVGHRKRAELENTPEYARSAKIAREHLPTPRNPEVKPEFLAAIEVLRPLEKAKDYEGMAASWDSLKDHLEELRKIRDHR